MAYFSSLLYLKEFRCVEETDEVGNDSPYFVVFVGNKSGQPFSDVVRVRDPDWDGAASTGKLFQPNLWVHNQCRHQLDCAGGADRRRLRR